MNLEKIYQEFIERLNKMTAEELKAEIEKAREDSKDSWIMEDEDVVRVVRCKNCGYSCACYSDDGEDLYECCKDVIFGNADTTVLHTSNWFCADGKRYDE